MKMRKKKHLRKKLILDEDAPWFTITPEAIKRMEDYLNSTRLTRNQRITFVPDELGGVLAGPTKEV